MNEYEILSLMYMGFIFNATYFVGFVLFTWLGFIIHTIKQISDILEISEAEVEKITSNNFFNLFKNVKASSIL